MVFYGVDGVTVMSGDAFDGRTPRTVVEHLCKCPGCGTHAATLGYVFACARDARGNFLVGGRILAGETYATEVALLDAFEDFWLNDMHAPPEVVRGIREALEEANQQSKEEENDVEYC